MQNLFRYVLAGIVAVVVFGSASQINAQDPQYVRALYGKMGENQKTLRSLKTTVRMERFNTQLGIPDDAREGTALYVPAGAKNANVRIDWTKGAQETLSVVDGKYMLYQPRLGQVIEGKTKEVQKRDAGSALSFINMTPAQLKQNFDAKWLGQEVVANVHSAYKMKLTPKTPQSFKEADIWVNESGMPVQIKLYEKNGDVTTVLLLDIQKNASINKNQLKLSNLPKEVKRVKG
jgi:outer membrane lipoprotein-sorting protein